MIKIHFTAATAAVAALLALAAPSSLQAATDNVTLVGLTFSPPNLSIPVNDTVKWTWASSPHNVTSTGNPQAWTASPTMNSGFTYSVQFTTAGTFPYECTIHAASGMLGSIIVTNVPIANVPPTISLTSPVNGTVYAAPATLNLLATATDSDGTVASVQFLIGSVIISNRTSAPFAATTNNLVAGSYLISAVASDNLGAKNTNSVTVSVVTPISPTISSLQKSAGTVQFNYAANAGLSYVVQKSTNLTSAAWVSLSTNQAAGSSVAFIDSHATNTPAFYRVGRMPNP